MKVGDNECDVMKGFQLYITTKLANPAYTPEIFAATSIIDFTVTMQGLEDQLLARTIQFEKAELEEERVALATEVSQNKKKMKELEDNLLFKLVNTKGSLVDDESLIQVLQTTKVTAVEVNEKIRVANETTDKISIAREEYRPIAIRGSILCASLLLQLMHLSRTFSLTPIPPSVTCARACTHTQTSCSDFLPIALVGTSRYPIFLLCSQPGTSAFALIVCLCLSLHRVHQLLSDRGDVDGEPNVSNVAGPVRLRLCQVTSGLGQVSHAAETYSKHHRALDVRGVLLHDPRPLHARQVPAHYSACAQNRHSQGRALRLCRTHTLLQL